MSYECYDSLSLNPIGEYFNAPIFPSFYQIVVQVEIGEPELPVRSFEAKRGRLAKQKMRLK
jgi:hypothetical protein